MTISDKKFIEETFGKPLSRQQIMDKVVRLLQIHTSLTYGDLYDEVFLSKNGTVPSGEILETQLHHALRILIDDGLVEHRHATPYRITGKGLKYTPSKFPWLTNYWQWAKQGIWNFILFLGSIGAVLAGIWYAIDLYTRFLK